MNNEKKAPVRQIKFRGMTISGDWVHGNYSVLNKDYSTVRKGHYISNKGGAPFAYMVRPETVGQFTGLLDKNGKEVYEGDMVLGSMKYKGVTLMPFRAFVFYNEKVACWQIKYETTTNNFATDFIYSYEIEIVGHIHEGKETKGNGYG